MEEPIFITERLNLQDYVNSKTGETLDSELPKGSRLKRQTPTDRKKLKFKNYVSSDAILDEYLCSNLPPADYRRFRHLSCWLETPFNIVSTGNHRPHTLDTLEKKLNMNKDEIRRLIHRLEDYGLAVWAICQDFHPTDKIIMFNPYVTRKRSTLNKQMLTLFSKDIEIKKPVTKPKKSAVKQLIAA